MKLIETNYNNESLIDDKLAELFKNIDVYANSIDITLNFRIRDIVHYKVSVILYGKIIQLINIQVSRVME